MRINVGSMNQVKVSAVTELTADYPLLAGSSVRALDAPSEVSDQPKSLEETVRGAVNRARNAHVGCDLSFGIEAGLMQVPYSKTGYMDVSACAIFDGVEIHLGLSSAFECPQDVTNCMLAQGLDMARAFHLCGYTDNPKLGQAEGAIGVLTKGRVTRKDYTKQAVRTALIHLEAHARVRA